MVVICCQTLGSKFVIQILKLNYFSSSLLNYDSPSRWRENFSLKYLFIRITTVFTNWRVKWQFRFLCFALTLLRKIRWLSLPRSLPSRRILRTFCIIHHCQLKLCLYCIDLGYIYVCFICLEMDTRKMIHVLWRGLLIFESNFHIHFSGKCLGGDWVRTYAQRILNYLL